MGAGSPVHTGIDPFNHPYEDYSNRFPRTHGDRPFVEYTGGGDDEVPPYTRG